MSFLSGLKKALGNHGSHSAAQQKHRAPSASSNRQKVTARAAAAPGSYRLDKPVRGRNGQPRQGARANVEGRRVSNTQQGTRRHQPVQAAARQYSGWWGNR